MGDRVTTECLHCDLLTQALSLSPAIDYANKVRMALFVYDLTGRMKPVNGVARQIAGRPEAIRREIREREDRTRQRAAFRESFQSGRTTQAARATRGEGLENVQHYDPAKSYTPKSNRSWQPVFAAWFATAVVPARFLWKSATSPSPNVLRV